jgi:hypothetical protein
MNREYERTLLAGMRLLERTDVDEVDAVYIVGGRRPPESEIRGVQSAVRGLAVAVDQFGDVSIRRTGRTAVAPRVLPRKPARVVTLLHRLATWDAGFVGLAGGVR